MKIINDDPVILDFLGECGTIPTSGKLRTHRSVAQFGRALRSGRRGRVFESRHPDHKKQYGFCHTAFCFYPTCHHEACRRICAAGVASEKGKPCGLQILRSAQNDKRRIRCDVYACGRRNASPTVGGLPKPRALWVRTNRRAGVYSRRLPWEDGCTRREQAPALHHVLPWRHIYNKEVFRFRRRRTKKEPPKRFFFY